MCASHICVSLTDPGDFFFFYELYTIMCLSIVPPVSLCSRGVFRDHVFRIWLTWCPGRDETNNTFKKTWLNIVSRERKGNLGSNPNLISCSNKSSLNLSFMRFHYTEKSNFDILITRFLCRKIIQYEIQATWEWIDDKKVQLKWPHFQMKLAEYLLFLLDKRPNYKIIRV